MKSEFKENQVESKFPKLMRHVGNPENPEPLEEQFIVAFSSHRTGVIVSKNSESTSVLFTYSDYWNKDQFVPFHGTVTITS